MSNPISFECSANELTELRKNLKLSERVESLSDIDKRKLAASFKNPKDNLRMLKEISNGKYNGSIHETS